MATPDPTPRNALGQSPTRTPTETKARLEEKEHAGRGRANKDRISAQIKKIVAPKRSPT
jgi:hypothetical protein